MLEDELMTISDMPFVYNTLLGYVVTGEDEELGSIDVAVSEQGQAKVTLDII